MGELSGFVFVLAGLVVGGVSLWVTFIRPIEKPALFYLTLVVGIGFIVYGVYKFLSKRKKTEALLEQKVKQSAERHPYSEEEIDADEIRRRMRQQGGPFSQTAAAQQGSQPGAQAATHPQHAQHQQQAYQQYAARQQYQQPQQGTQYPANNAQYAPQHHAQAHHQQPGYPQAQQPQQPQYAQQYQQQGYPQQHAQPAAAHQKRFCPSCGTPVAGHHRFCASCGSQL